MLHSAVEAIFLPPGSRKTRHEIQDSEIKSSKRFSTVCAEDKFRAKWIRATRAIYQSGLHRVRDFHWRPVCNSELQYKNSRLRDARGMLLWRKPRATSRSQCGAAGHYSETQIHVSLRHLKAWKQLQQPEVRDSSPDKLRRESAKHLAELHSPSDSDMQSSTTDRSRIPRILWRDSNVSGHSAAVRDQFSLERS